MKLEGRVVVYTAGEDLYKGLVNLGLKAVNDTLGALPIELDIGRESVSVTDVMERVRSHNGYAFGITDGVFSQHGLWYREDGGISLKSLAGHGAFSFGITVNYLDAIFGVPALCFIGKRNVRNLEELAENYRRRPLRVRKPLITNANERIAVQSDYESLFGLDNDFIEGKGKCYAAENPLDEIASGNADYGVMMVLDGNEFSDSEVGVIDVVKLSSGGIFLNSKLQRQLNRCLEDKEFWEKMRKAEAQRALYLRPLKET